MVDSFLASLEYEQRYGRGQGDDAFVDTVFQNVLGRGPDPDGEAYWTVRLADGMPRAEMIANFAESPENKQAVNSVFDE